MSIRVFLWNRSEKSSRGFTLVELLFIIVILVSLVTIAYVLYSKYLDKARNLRAIAEISQLQKMVLNYELDTGTLPSTLDDLQQWKQLDPWKRPYQYEHPPSRKNSENKPLNDDYDLYSNGKDGKSKKRITHKDSQDDIIRAHQGIYIGLASEY